MFVFCFLLLVGCRKNDQTNNKIQIIATTDIHGSIFSYDFINNQKTRGSLGALTKYLDSLKNKDNIEILLFDNGDILQGQPPVYYCNYLDTANKHIASRVLNFMNYDAATVGNHDIEPGHAVYDKIKKEFNFPWLAANIINDKTDQPYFQPYIVIDKAGMKIAVLGMVTPAIPNWLPKEVYSGMYFEDMLISSKKWVKKIRGQEQPDLMIGLFHSGLGKLSSKDMKENAVLDIANKVNGFDIIFYGHDHQQNILKTENQHGDTVLLINPGANAKKAAVVNVSTGKSMNKTYLKRSKAGFIDLQKYEPTEEFKMEFEPFKKEIKKFVSNKVAYLPENIFAGNALFGPSKWMQLIHKVQLKHAHADLSFSAPLSIYNKLNDGELTTGDLFEFYRFRNLLYTIKLSGKEIHDYLEYSYANWFNTMNSSAGHLLNFKLDSNNQPFYSENYGHYLLNGTYYNFDSGYGIDYVVDLTKPSGERVQIKSFSNGDPFFPDQYYKVALNSYRANGGGGHLTEGAGLSKSEIDQRVMNIRKKDIRYLILEEIQKEDTLKINLEKNWKVKPFSWWKETKSKDSLLLFK